MPNRYKKIQPKLKPLPFIIIGIIIVAVVALILVLRDTPKQAFYKEYTAYGAQNLSEDHSFKKISYKTFKNKLAEGENMIVYFGMPNCQECIAEVPLYDIEFKAEDIKLDEYFDYIYYVDVRTLKTKEVTEIVREYFYNDVESEPLLLYFEDGEVQIDRFVFGTGARQGDIYHFFKEVKNRQK